MALELPLLFQVLLSLMLAVVVVELIPKLVESAVLVAVELAVKALLHLLELLAAANSPAEGLPVSLEQIFACNDEIGKGGELKKRP